jgi:hypothetical protein
MKVSHSLLEKLTELLFLFEENSSEENIRGRVQALIPAFDTLRDLGKSLVPDGLSLSARDRILAYFLAYPHTVLNEKEIALVAGISEWARRVRELRVQFGWKIVSGITLSQLVTEGELERSSINCNDIGPNDYMLIDPEQDRDAAHRWHMANDIRRGTGGGKEKILAYLRANVGKVVTGEELYYVAQSSEWARRARELRTEDGWPVSTKMSGNPELAVGEYILEVDRQNPSHDRHIPEGIRRSVMQRDHYTCRKCGWNYALWNKTDPRFLEIHHIIHHAKGGVNLPQNLITYCNICHDNNHKLDRNA